jgi:glycosyltransferase involved in cell wall biosynthesis
MDSVIDILMATYNGENYVAEQIDSILNQSHKAIRLIIRDDLSTDRTVEIIQDYLCLHPERIVLIPSSARLGPKANFSVLLEFSSKNYVMFADQDDIWLPTKVETTFKKMCELESLHSTSCPLLVHTDLKVVDQDLKLIHPSFWKYSKIFPKKSRTLNRLLVQNVITGCTVMINRALIKIIGTIPSQTLMHDWWVGLVASAFGLVVEIPEATILYRQHKKNTLGAKKFGSVPHLKAGLTKLLNGNRDRGHQHNKHMQTLEFFDRYHKHLGLKHNLMVKDYLNMKDMPVIKSRYYLLRHRLFKNGFLRNVVAFFFQAQP